MNDIDDVAKLDFVARVAARLSHEINRLRQSGLSEDSCKRILVSLSGGPDSTALTVALSQLAAEMGWEVSACHVNHGLRGLESDLDQEFCTSLCADLNVEFFVYRLDEFPAQDHSDSVAVSENVLRELRYRFIFEHARATDCHIVVAGHTLDDQAETLLFRLFRGTSPTGLTGMESARELVRGSDIWLIRPMLNLTKADCQRFLAVEQIGAHIDSSNENTQFTRNFIRSQIVPKIDERFPGWKQRIERLRTIITEQEDLLDIESDRCFAAALGNDGKGEFLNLPMFENAHMALKRRVVAKMLRDRSIEPTFERVENVLSVIAGSDNAFTLSADWEVRLDKKKLRWLPLEEDKLPSAFLMQQETVIDLPEGHAKTRTNIVSWLDKSLKVEKLSGDKVYVVASVHDGLEVLADLTRVSRPLILRLRRPGDIIQPFGMAQKVRLKKYLHTHSRSHLDSLKHTVVLTDCNEVLWVPGVGISELLRYDKIPSHRLTIQDLTTSTDSVWA